MGELCEFSGVEGDAFKERDEQFRDFPPSICQRVLYVCPAMAGMRNYLYSLNGELEGTGVFAGTLTIGALITSSDPSADQGFPGDAEAATSFPTVHPDTLAGLYWDMYVRRSAVEQAYPERVLTA